MTIQGTKTNGGERSSSLWLENKVASWVLAERTMPCCSGGLWGESKVQIANFYEIIMDDGYFDHFLPMSRQAAPKEAKGAIKKQPQSGTMRTDIIMHHPCAWAIETKQDTAHQSHQTKNHSKTCTEFREERRMRTTK